MNPENRKNKKLSTYTFEWHSKWKILRQSDYFLQDLRQGDLNLTVKVLNRREVMRGGLGRPTSICAQTPPHAQTTK